MVEHERITTTLAKAKEMRPWIEKLVQQAKIRDRNAAVYINGTLTTQSAYKKLTTEIAPRFKDRPAGFTRIEYLGRRRNDKAKVAMIEIIGNPVEEYEKNELELEKEQHDLQTFWQWEKNLLDDE